MQAILSSVFDCKREDWNRLVGNSIPMMHWEWFAAMEVSEAASPRHDFQAAHLLIKKGKRVQAIAPLYWKTTPYAEWTAGSVYQTVAGQFGITLDKRLVGLIPYTPVSGYQFLLDPNEDQEALTRELLKGITHMIQAEHSLVQLSHINLDNELLERLLLEQRFCEEKSFTYRWISHGEKDFAAFLKRFPAKRRNKMKHEISACAAQGIKLESLRNAAITHDTMKKMFRCYTMNHVKHYGDKGALAPAFWKFLQEEFRDHLRLVVASREHDVLGMSLYVENERGLFGRWWGTEEEIPFLHFNTCYYYPVECAIRERKDFIDPGFQGDFKRWRGFEPVPMKSYVYSADPRLQMLIEQVVKKV